MKKFLVLIIAIGLVSTTFAETTFKIYGQLHASVDLLDGADGAAKETTVSSNSSRIGITGSADLTDGLKAIYKAEFGVDTGGPGSGIIDRNQFVGLAGSFGAVLLGRHDTPMKTVGRKADLFWSTQLGQNRNIVRQDWNWDARPDNVIAYMPPKMGNFQLLTAYVTDIAESDANTAISVNGFYKTGKLLLGFGYETYSLDDAVFGDVDPNALRLMGTYKLGKAKIVGFFQSGDLGSENGKSTVLGFGLAYNMSATGIVKAQFYTRSDDDLDADGSLLAVGYDHKYSKKTHVYIQYAMTSDLGKIGGRGHDEGVLADENGDAGGLSFGMRHKF